MRFNGICIVSPDVRRLADFYEQILGVEGTEDTAFVSLGTEGAALSIFHEKGMENMAAGSLQGAGRGGYTIEFEVDDVDRHYGRLQAMQVPVVKPPTTQTWGRRSVWFRDPDGNIVNFYANVPPGQKTRQGQSTIRR